MANSTIVNLAQAGIDCQFTAKKKMTPGQGQHRPEDQQQLRQPSLPSASRVQNIQRCLPAAPVDVPAGEQLSTHSREAGVCSKTG
jgi:hypothetical protein